MRCMHVHRGAGTNVPLASKAVARAESAEFLIARNTDQRSRHQVDVWFTEWKEAHGKVYRSHAHENRARKNFQKSLVTINGINNDDSLSWWAKPNE
jgi:hypothetical protein